MANVRITRAGVKTVARFIVARAVQTTISLIVHKSAEPDTTYEVASVHVGAFVLGEWAGDSVKPFVNAQIDEAADFILALRGKTEPETEEEPAS